MGNVVSLVESSPLARDAAVAFGVQWALFPIAAYFQTEKFFDLADTTGDTDIHRVQKLQGGGTFALLSLLSLRWGGRYYQCQKIQTGMVCTWALRLSLFLFHRVLKVGSDSRFKHVRKDPKTFLLYWTIQGLWVFATLLPTLLLNEEKSNPALGERDYAGWGLWALGMLVEIIADYQKSAFKNNPANKDKFIQSGLWSLSRHPNYLGEILLQTGLYISASSVFRGYQHLSAVSPVFVFLLLTRLSGIPILERQGMKRWGQNPSYLAYRRNTAVLIPYIW